MDQKLKELVDKIFKIIPSYYDQREADEIARLITVYLDERLEEKNNATL